jgi:antitoxin component HigA of HigAB toxin-antitoxin module
MRYILDTTDEQGIIGMQIKKWEKDNKLTILEKADPIIEIKNHLEKVARALNTLKEAGYDSEVMEIWLCRKTGLGLAKIKSILHEQDKFFKAIGVLK